MTMQPTPGAKMMYLIRRRPGVSREELIAHWFANHMPGVIRSMELQASAGRTAARRYIATLFDAQEEPGWDGVAQLWFDAALPAPAEPHGTRPADSFQERAEPYVPWATTEYVVLDGELPVTPLTLNAPFPTTRSGFVKGVFLLAAKADADHGALCAHWLDVHAPNVVEHMTPHGGFRYVISQSLNPESEPYAGMAELYFRDAEGWQAFLGALPDDGLGNYIERAELHLSGTEMIGIP